MGRPPRWLLAAPLAVTLAATGCTEEASDETPAGTVRLFLDAMERSEREPAALREAYGLLALPARRALTERARLAGSLGGRDLQPWEMLVRGRARRSFAVGEGTRGMREEIDGASATVQVREPSGTRSADVQLVREDGRWRIVLDLPPVRAPAQPAE